MICEAAVKMLAACQRRVGDVRAAGHRKAHHIPGDSNRPCD